MWELGDYPGLAGRLAPAAAAVVDRLDARAGGLSGLRFVDVAAGTGNVASTAAARGATVTACDFAPRMVELGARRTGPAVRWWLAALDALGLSAGAVDVVGSNFGLIFAPDPAATLAELHRVLVPGGLVGFTAWPVDGFIAQMSRRMVEFLPDQVREASDAMAWGDRSVLTGRLAERFTDVEVVQGALRWSFDSPTGLTDFLLAHSPTHVAAVAVAGNAAPDMLRSITELAGSDGGPVVFDTEYLVVTARTRH